MLRVPTVLLMVLSLCPIVARAQSGSDVGPHSGGHEFQVWTTGAHSIRGGISNTPLWNAGVRYGWVLTDLHGPGFLRGRFEYAVDAIPAFVLFEPSQTVFGLSFDPIVLRWDFQERGRVMPYAELSGGALFTNHAVPPGADAVNFTPSGGLGISIPQGRFRWSAELHFMHISDAHLTTYNPGVNTLGLRIGFGWFSRPKE